MFFFVLVLNGLANPSWARLQTILFASEQMQVSGQTQKNRRSLKDISISTAIYYTFLTTPFNLAGKTRFWENRTRRPLSAGVIPAHKKIFPADDGRSLAYKEMVLAPAGELSAYNEMVLAGKEILPSATKAVRHIIKRFWHLPEPPCHIKKQFWQITKTFRHLPESFRHIRKWFCHIKKTFRHI